MPEMDPREAMRIHSTCGVCFMAEDGAQQPSLVTSTRNVRVLLGAGHDRDQAAQLEQHYFTGVAAAQP